jgi:hypothetical protein
MSFGVTSFGFSAISSGMPGIQSVMLILTGCLPVMMAAREGGGIYRASGIGVRKQDALLN